MEKQEDHHYFHTKGWTRELWIEELGMSAVHYRHNDQAIGEIREALRL